MADKGKLRGNYLKIFIFILLSSYLIMERRDSMLLFTTCCCINYKIKKNGKCYSEEHLVTSSSSQELYTYAGTLVQRNHIVL
jgi:hypothetical protein